MKIPTREYSVKAFIDELMNVTLPSYQRLKVACFMTSFSKWYDRQKMINLEDIFGRYGVRIQKLGEIRRLQTKYFDSQIRKSKIAIFYCYLDPSSEMLICFTDEKMEAIEQTLGQIAENSPGFYYTFISFATFNKIKQIILEYEPFAKCTYLSTKYVPQLTMKSQIRPNIEKRIIYYGDDGLETLEELRQYYGVYPTVMRYYIPNMGIYEINCNGIFSLWAEEKMVASRRFLLHLCNVAISEVLRSKKIIETSSYKLIPVETDRKIFKIPKIIPWIIKFSHEIEFIDSESLIEIMSDNNFSLFNEVREKGSIRLNGLVMDEKKQTIFSIDVDDRRIIVAPTENLSFDSFMRFYKTILDNFDPNATCEEFRG